MRELVLVATGGAVGACLRYGLTRALPNVSNWPSATFAANVIGCALAGVLLYFVSVTALKPELRLLLMTGVLGGFTTFSAFSTEALQLIQRQQLALALGYVLTSVLVCIAGTALGFAVARWLSQ